VDGTLSSSSNNNGPSHQSSSEGYAYSPLLNMNPQTPSAQYAPL
jgi:hypothetical protein